MARSFSVRILLVAAALTLSPRTGGAEDGTDSSEAVTLKSLSESLAVAKAEAEKYKAESERLRLQTEALGMAAVNAETRLLQERLISAANDLRLVEREKQALASRLVGLTEAALALLSDPENIQSKERLQTELINANRDLPGVRDTIPPPPPAIEAAKVVSQKPALGLVVIDAGRESGLRTGTPMKIVRNEQTIASGLVVDVRKRVSGLLITSAEGRDAVRTGDTVKPETTKSSN